MSASAAPITSPTLGSLARDALNDAEGNTGTAIEALTATLHTHPALLRELIEAAVLDAVTYRVELQLRHRREKIVRAASASGRGAVLALAQGISNALLDMPLAGGLLLRNAERHAVVEQSRRYSTQAGDMAHKARWLDMIAQAVEPGRRVGEIINEARALDLWEAARNAR